MKVWSALALWASVALAQNITGPAIKINQVGYLANGPKKASFVTNSTKAVDWTLSRGGAVKARGKTIPRGIDTASSTNVQIIDVSTPRVPSSLLAACVPLSLAHVSLSKTRRELQQLLTEPASLRLVLT